MYVCDAAELDKESMCYRFEQIKKVTAIINLKIVSIALLLYEDNRLCRSPIADMSSSVRYANDDTYKGGCARSNPKS